MHVEHSLAFLKVHEQHVTQVQVIGALFVIDNGPFYQNYRHAS